jgi:hypothetical protein
MSAGDDIDTSSTLEAAHRIQALLEVTMVPLQTIVELA